MKAAKQERTGAPEVCFRVEYVDHAGRWLTYGKEDSIEGARHLAKYVRHEEQLEARIVEVSTREVV